MAKPDTPYKQIPFRSKHCPHSWSHQHIYCCFKWKPISGRVSGSWWRVDRLGNSRNHTSQRGEAIIHTTHSKALNQQILYRQIKPRPYESWSSLLETAESTRSSFVKAMESDSSANVSQNQNRKWLKTMPEIFCTSWELYYYFCVGPSTLFSDAEQGNPKFVIQVYKSLLAILNSQSLSPTALQMASQALRMLLVKFTFGVELCWYL